MADKCDVFFSLYQSPTILPKSVRHIMFVHDIIPKLFPKYLHNNRKKIYWELTEAAILEAGKIIANSSRTEKDLIHELKINPAKISVNYLDVDAIYKKEISENHRRIVSQKYALPKSYILAGGGMEIRKNVERYGVLVN